MNRGSELRQLLRLHHQARGMLLMLDEEGSFALELKEKDRIIKQLEWELNTSSRAELDKEIDLYAAPRIQRKAVAAGR